MVDIGKIVSILQKLKKRSDEIKSVTDSYGKISRSCRLVSICQAEFSVYVVVGNLSDLTVQ